MEKVPLGKMIAEHLKGTTENLDKIDLDDCSATNTSHLANLLREEAERYFTKLSFPKKRNRATGQSKPLCIPHDTPFQNESFPRIRGTPVDNSSSSQATLQRYNENTVDRANPFGGRIKQFPGLYG